MLRLTLPGHAEAMDGSQHLHDAFWPPAPLQDFGSLVAPRRDRQCYFASHYSQHQTILPRQRVSFLIELLRVRRTEGEEVAHVEASVAPVPREAPAAPNGGIIFVLVGGRRVEANDHHHRQVPIPYPPEHVPMTPVLVECSPLKWQQNW